MMWDIKIEPANLEICRGCLTSDRKLFFVEVGDMYCSLLTEDQKLGALSLSHIALCWECKALLRRTQKFQEQVQKAYTILQNLLHLSSAKPTLSSLTVYRKIEYDAVLKESKPNEQPIFYKEPKPTIEHDNVIVPTKYKSADTKKNHPITEKKEGIVESMQDVLNRMLTENKNNDFKIEHASDDSDDNEIFEAEDRHSSSPEDTSETKYDTRISPRKAATSVPTVKLLLQNDVTCKRKVYTHIPTCKPLNRKVEIKKTEKAPLIKTPQLLEIELKKLMPVKTAASEEPIGPKKKRGRKKIADVNNDCKFTSTTNAEKHNDEDNETKTMKQKMTELDPDFSLEEDVENYATDDSEEFKRVSPKKIKKASTNPNVGNEDTTEQRKRKLSRTVTQYKNIIDVAPYFTEIEMSEQDLKSVLEKDDAIVNKNKPIKCTICGKMFKQNKTLNHHAFNLHKAKYPGQFRKGNWYNPPLVFNQKSVWRCSLCERMMRQEHIVTHMNEYHRSQFRCTADGCEWIEKLIWEKEDLDKHWNAVHRQSTCDICGTDKKTKKLMELHIQSAHAPPASHECPICLKTLSSRYNLQLHQQLVHEPPSEPAELRYCVECDITFKRIVAFQKHFSAKHSGKPKVTWPCNQCDKVMADKHWLQRHVDLVHKGKTEFSCHICGKYFSRNQVLQRHLDAHNNIKAPKTLPCSVCGRMFQNKRILRQHMYTHTGERPYKCTHCETAFTQPHCLRVHLAKQHHVDARVRTDGTIHITTEKTEETRDNVEN